MDQGTVTPPSSVTEITRSGRLASLCAVVKESPEALHKGDGEAGTSSTEISSNSRSELPGSQEREENWRLGFLNTREGRGLEMQIPGD